MKLEIDFVSQHGNAYRNDCGPACLSALTGRPLEKIYQAAKLKPGDMMHMSQMLDTLMALRVPREHIRPLHLPDARRWLANGNPIIALINYGRLPRQLRATDYDKNHYVVLVGYEPDGSFLVHDPLWPDQQGAFRRWPDVALGEAWTNPIEALPLQGIVVQRPFPVLEATVADVLPLVADAAEGQALNHLQRLLDAMGIEPGPMAERVDRAMARVVMWQSANG